MSRTKSTKPNRIPLHFRVPAELLDRAEAWHRERRERLQLVDVHNWTMTDSVCQLLEAGLKAESGYTIMKATSAGELVCEKTGPIDIPAPMPPKRDRASD